VLPVVDFLDDVHDVFPLILGEKAFFRVHAVPVSRVDTAVLIGFIAPDEHVPARLLVELAYQFHDRMIHALVKVVEKGA